MRKRGVEGLSIQKERDKAERVVTCGGKSGVRAGEENRGQLLKLQISKIKMLK
jgi:hypothetical protein